MTNRQLLFEATGPTGPARIATELARLEALYLKAHKRKLPPDILSISHWGDKEKPVYGLTAYYEPAQLETVRFLSEQVGGSSC